MPGHARSSNVRTCKLYCLVMHGIADKIAHAIGKGYRLSQSMPLARGNNLCGGALPDALRCLRLDLQASLFVASGHLLAMTSVVFQYE